MLDLNTIDAELRLIAAVLRPSIRSLGGNPSIRHADGLLDERLDRSQAVRIPPEPHHVGVRCRTSPLHLWCPLIASAADLSTGPENVTA
jgi:hypothetical protein